MVWKEDESGAWFDEFDGAEKVFYGMSQAFKAIGKEHGSVYAVCQISSTLDESLDQLLYNSWKALRTELPSLAVFADDGKKKYLGATPKRIELWAKETFHLSEAASASEVVPTLHMRRLPCLFFLPRSSEIILHCSHWRIDALGACMVLNKLLDHASGNATNTGKNLPENQKLSPSLEDAYGSPTSCTPEMTILAEAVRRRNFETSYPTAGLPFDGEPNTPPKQSRPLAIELTLESTRRLIAACKTKGVSVTAAVHAACSEAVFERSPSNNHDYSTVVSVNMRDYLPAPYNTAAYACATYVTGITHTVHRKDDIITRARQLTGAYKGDWDAREYMNALRPIYKVHGEALQLVARAGGRPQVSNVTVSSLGLVERYLKKDHGPIIVERFRLGSAIMNRQMTLYIWTFGARLTLSLDSNEAFYEDATVRAVLDSIVHHLEKELDICLGTD